MTLLDAIARRLVLKFMEQISAGCLIVKEEDGTVLTFKGSKEKCPLEVVLKVHNPSQYYWKMMTDSDLGFADAYIQGDFSFEDKEEGCSNLISLMIANKQSNTSISLIHENRGWWATGKYLLKHVLRQNTLRQARRNISSHYDMSNGLFELFLDEKMQYSSGIFKSKDEDLNVAQQRKMTSLIDKARIRKGHEVLDIGCGWGYLAVEAVKRTGCNYTGITLSEEQLKYAQALAKKEGLQDNIKILLCDYREVPKTCKYDRIISVEMVEHVGNEYMEEFFKSCESMLADDGLFVLQFISITEELFPALLRTPEFLKEYIFPGGCLVSLARMLSAMAAGSRLSKIMALGFDEKFMRTMEYYFSYAAGNVATLGDPYQGFPSAFSC
ncbi:Mycolic acid cyclopropane synthase [Corchorus olitorius]|uniref:Mycolic acid cyclopropane synthase n=1 Tax=Corchorus olitorius TaxID=93759 RepID=A0A1R3HZR2_9ROSI|nr:Mycolic acid cyclopropane synthase [Corchorus olitorius]